MISNVEHPKMDRLSDFLMQPQASEHADLRLHLLQCQSCRQQISRLSSIKQAIPTLARTDTAMLESSPQLIEQYVDGQLNQKQQQQARDLLQNPVALKAALHYASHSAAMKRELSQTQDSYSGTKAEPGIPKKESGNGFLDSIIDVLSFRPPVWVSASIAAGFVVAVSLMLTPMHTSLDTSSRIATYQDSGLMYFQDKSKPGIGFFSNAHQSGSAYEGINVSLIGDAIHMDWPAVENAKSYTVQLQLTHNENKSLVGEKTTTINRTSFDKHIPQAGKRYEWTLSGETGDAKSFFTTGGFVINQ